MKITTTSGNPSSVIPSLGIKKSLEQDVSFVELRLEERKLLERKLSMLVGFSAKERWKIHYQVERFLRKGENNE